MYHGNSLCESLNRYSNINGIAAGRSVAVRWREQLRSMYEGGNPQEKIAIVVLLDGIDAFLCGHKDEPWDVVEFGERPKRPAKRAWKNSWLNNLFQSVRS